MKKIPKNMKFEAALSELEKQVELLESGDLSLDASLEAFQYGTELSKICLGKLNTAKAAVEKLVVTGDDTYHTEPFATMAEDGAGTVKEQIVRYDDDDSESVSAAYHGADVAGDDDDDDDDDDDNDDDDSDDDTSDDDEALGEVTADEETEE